jgi:hypothetical protein
VAIRLVVALGFFAAAIAAAAAWLRTPEWADAPDLAAAGSLVPMLQVALSPVAGVLMRTAVLMTLLTAIDQMTAGWTRRRVPAIAGLLVIGLLDAGLPAGTHYGGWFAGAALTAAALTAAYVTLLRFDLTMAPLAIGTMLASGVVMRGARQPFPGALIGSIAAAVLTVSLGWWLSGALARARATTSSAAAADAPVSLAG